ncbi:MAG: hypothetical protein ABJQ11_06790, partial [Roseibium sp.]
RMKGAEPLPPSPEMTGLYLADMASGAAPPLPVRSAPSTVAYRASPGTMRSATLPWIARTAPSPPC